MRNPEQSRNRNSCERGIGIRGLALMTAASALISMAAIKPRRFDPELDTNFSVGSCQRNPDSWAYTGEIDPDIPPTEPDTHTIGLAKKFGVDGRPEVEDGLKITQTTSGEFILDPLYGDRRVLSPIDVAEGPVTFDSGSGNEVAVFGKRDPKVGKILSFAISCNPDNTYLDQAAHTIDLIESEG